MCRWHGGPQVSCLSSSSCAALCGGSRWGPCVCDLLVLQNRGQFRVYLFLLNFMAWQDEGPVCLPPPALNCLDLI